MKKLIWLLAVLGFYSCEDEAKPKPQAYLSLEYPSPVYKTYNINCPYSFEINEAATINPSKSKRACWLDIDYPNLNGTIFITYQPINNNLKDLLIDGQKLPLQHTIKADEIEGDTYINKKRNVYGTFYEVKGDAASQAQFYLTDSVNHFLTGAIYFNTKPNFDSIVPAADYLGKDIRHLMESVQWK